MALGASPPPPRAPILSAACVDGGDSDWTPRGAGSQRSPAPRACSRATLPAWACHLDMRTHPVLFLLPLFLVPESPNLHVGVQGWSNVWGGWWGRRVAHSRGPAKGWQSDPPVSHRFPPPPPSRLPSRPLILLLLARPSHARRAGPLCISGCVFEP